MYARKPHAAKGFVLSQKMPKNNTCFPQTWRPPQSRRFLEQQRRKESKEQMHKVNSTGCSWLKASAMFLDVPGFLFTAAAGRLDRDNTTTRISASETQRATDVWQKAKNQSGACSIHNLGKKLRGGSSCGSGTVQHYHVSTTFLSLRQLHYSEVGIHLFPLEYKMPQCDPCTALYCHTHLFFLYSSFPSPQHSNTPPPPQASYKIHIRRRKALSSWQL